MLLQQLQHLALYLHYSAESFAEDVFKEKTKGLKFEMLSTDNIDDKLLEMKEIYEKKINQLFSRFDITTDDIKTIREHIEFHKQIIKEPILMQ